jgi:hypothetical protein
VQYDAQYDRYGTEGIDSDDLPCRSLKSYKHDSSLVYSRSVVDVFTQSIAAKAAPVEDYRITK